MGRNPRSGFGFWTLVFLVVANMVGAGVFTTSGFLLESMGDSRLVLLAWLLGGFIAICGALSYGLLAERIPVSGGEYAYLTRSGFPFAGFVAGWVSLLAGFSGAIAFAALALESHLPGNHPEKVPAILVVILGAALHGRRRLLGAGAQNVTVILKMILVATIIVVGFMSLTSSSWPGLKPHNPPSLSQLPLFAEALVWISLSYSGFNAAVYVAGESSSPQTVRRALVTGTAVVTLMYVLLNALFVCAPPASEVSGKEDVAALAAGWIGGPSFEGFVRLVISLALLTSVLAMMMTGPRVYGKMAEDGILPQIFIIRPDRVGPPVILQMALALLLILSGNLRDLLGYLGLTLSLCAAVSVLCLFRKGRQESIQGWQVVPPLLFCGATLGVAILLVWRDPGQALGTIITIAAGAVAYFFLGASQRGKTLPD
jgi:APA family basic amino acid/polyamine antiporter